MAEVALVLVQGVLLAPQPSLLLELRVADEATVRKNWPNVFIERNWFSGRHITGDGRQGQGQTNSSHVFNLLIQFDF